MEFIPLSSDVDMVTVSVDKTSVFILISDNESSVFGAADSVVPVGWELCGLWLAPVDESGGFTPEPLVESEGF